MNKIQKRGKRILVMVLVLAILCTSLPCTFTFGPFTQIQPIHAAAEEQQIIWYKITTKINSSWGGHIAGEITITNNSSQPRQDWQIALSWQAQITSMWNGRYQQNGHSYLITPMEYNTILQPNASVSIGFLAEGDDTILDSFVSENFLTESGAEITDAEQRVSQAETPIVATEEPVATLIPTVGTPEPAVTVTPTITPTITSIQTPSPEPTTIVAPTVTPTITSIQTSSPEPTATVAPTATPTITPVQTPSPEPTASLEPVYPDLYLTSGITLQENTTCGSLYILSGGYVNLNGYTLTIQKDIRIHTDRNAFTGRGTVRLGGNLIQTPAAASGSLQLNDSVVFILCGSQSQKMELAYPETSYLGQLNLGGSQEVYLPEEIHCYSLSRLDKAHFPDTVRLQASYVYLDSDFEVPGNLELLGGGFWTRGHHVMVGGNLSFRGVANLNLTVETGSHFTVHGDLEINAGRLETLTAETEMTVEGNIRLNAGAISVYNGTLRTEKNLIVREAGEMALWGGLLEIGGDWETSSTVQRSQYHRGVIDLYGDLIQSETASVNSVNMEDEMVFRFRGNAPQHIRLQYPEQSSLGRLYLGDSQEVYLPEEIHCYSLSRLDKAHFPDTVRLQASYVYLDSDFEVPGNLELLGGGFWTQGHHVMIGGNLSFQGVANLNLTVETGSQFTVHGDLEINAGRLETLTAETEMTVEGSIRLNGGAISVYNGTLRTEKNLIVREAGEMALWGGLLEIGGDWETSSTVQRSQYHRGVIDLYGNLIQSETAGTDSINMENEMVFRLRGKKEQTVMLSHPDETKLGRLDLGNSAGVTFNSNNSYNEETLYLTGVSLKNLEKMKNKGSLCLEFDNIYLGNDLDYPGDLECQGNLILNNRNLTIRGNLEMDGSLSSPGTLDIHGNYTAVSGTTDCGTGTIRVRKNFRLRETASLYMREAAARLLVEGNFKTSATGSSILRAGTIELKGDLIYTQAANSDNIKMTGITLKLSGDSRQNIDLSFGAINGNVVRVDMTQATAVYFEECLLYAKYIKGFDKILNHSLVVVGLKETLEQDEHYHGSLQILGDLLDCAGYHFQVDGTLEVSGTVCILNKGTLSVYSSFSMYGTSILQMKQEEDRMIVGGSFKTMSTLCHSGMLTGGRMVLSGNFYEKGDPYSFDSTDQFTVAFVSTNDQYVHYDHRETSQIANTEGDYILDEDLIDKTCLTIDAVSYGIADGLGELAESPEEIVVAGAGAAAAALGVSLGGQVAAGVIFVLGIGGGVLLLKETYEEMSEIDNDYERLREIVKKVTKLVVLSIVMKAGEKAGTQAGELIKDTSLWQKCCKILKKKKPTEITEADLQKIAMTAAEHLESVKGCMGEEAYKCLLKYSGKYAEVDAMEVAEIIQTIYTRTEKELVERDIKILYQRLVDGYDAESIYNILVVTEHFKEFSDFNAEFALEVGKDADLSTEEKVWKIQKGYENVADKTDITVPADAKYLKGFTENGSPDYKWPKFLGFIRDTIRSITRKDGLPAEMDRYGYNGGTNFAAVPGKERYSFWERAIPYLRNEKAYHRFKVNGENYCDKIDAIRSRNFNKLNEILAGEEKDLITEGEFTKICNNYFKKISEMKAEEGITEDVTYGLKGTVAKYNSDTPELRGGAEQYTLPLNADDLITIKVLEEVK